MTSVHLVAGDDELLVLRALQRLLDRIRADGFDVDVYDASELEHLPEMRTASLFGGQACVVVRGVRTVAGSLRDELEEYLAAPDPDAVLVLTAVAAEPRKSPTGQQRKIARLAKAHGEVHEVRLPRDYDTAAWRSIVRDELQRLGRRGGRGVLDAILDHAGLDPGVIATRVAQVADGTPPGRDVTVEDVERHVEGHGRQSSFAVVDAVTDRDPAEALTVLRGLLEVGEEPLAVLGALAFRFRQLSQVRADVGPGAARISKGQWGRLKGVTRNFSVGELGWCTDRLATLDVDLKGGSELPPQLLLELAVIDLATPREVGAPWNPLAG